MENKIFNETAGYTGNGWSKYQLMVLNQLEDHTKLLTKLSEDLIQIQKRMEVDAANNIHEKKHIDILKSNIYNILHDDNGINTRLKKIEQEKLVNIKANIKLKAIWSAGGALIVFILMFFKDLIITFIKTL